MDSERYRAVMGHYPTGVVFVSGMCSGEPAGMVVGTFSSVSLDPPLVSFMPMKTSRSYVRLLESPVLCVNVLAHDQVDVCRTLAGSAADKFDKVPWSLSSFGAPVIEGAVAHVHCTRRTQVDAGDHWITLCDVVDMEVARSVTPMLFFQGGYGAFFPKSMSARGDDELFAALRLADVATPEVEALATRLDCEAAALVVVDDDELTTAVAAYGGDAKTGGQLGQRIPLVPPIGMAYIAKAAPPVAERWLATLADTDQLASYRRRLDSIVAHGVEITMAGSDARAFERLHDVLTDYATGRFTPAGRRAVISDLARAPVFTEEVRLDDHEVFDVGSIVAPVHNPEGDVALLVRIGQLPSSSTGATVKTWIALLKETVATIERSLVDGAGRARLEEYRKRFARSAERPA